MAFESIISGELARQAQGSRDIQNIFAQFAGGIEQGRQQRAQEEAQIQMAEAEVGAIADAIPNAVTPEFLERFQSSNKAGEKAALLHELKTGIELGRQQEQDALNQANIQSQIVSRGVKNLSSLPQSFEPRVVNVGGHELIETSQGKFTQPAQAKNPKSPIIRNVVEEGKTVVATFDPVTQERIGTLGEAPQQPKQILTPEEREDVKRGEFAMASNQALVEAGGAARRNLGSLNRAMSILESGKLETGKLADLKTEGLKLLKAVGVDLPQETLDSISSAEEFRARTIDQVLEKIQQTKGAISERENEMFQNASANLRNTVEGNKAIIRFAIAQAERDKKIANMVRDMRRKKMRAEEIDIAINDFINDPANDISSALEVDAPAGEASPEAPAFSRENPAQPQTQADFDSLEPGTPFVNPANGVLMIKR